MHHLSDDLKDLLRLLNRHHVDYAVCGGYAVGFHGFVRMTMGVDLLVRPDPENARRLMAALTEFGFGNAGIPPEAFLKEGTAVTLGAAPNQVDLLTSMGGGNPLADVFARAESAAVEGIPVRFVSRDDLIAAKRAAGRPKDLIDADELERLG